MNHKITSFFNYSTVSIHNFVYKNEIICTVGYEYKFQIHLFLIIFINFILLLQYTCSIVLRSLLYSISNGYKVKKVNIFEGQFASLT